MTPLDHAEDTVRRYAVRLWGPGCHVSFWKIGPTHWEICISVPRSHYVLYDRTAPSRLRLLQEVLEEFESFRVPP